MNGLSAPGLLAIVLDVAVEPPLAQAAAERLITRCSDPDAVMLVGEALSPASGNTAGRVRILNAIAGTWNVPERLFGPVAELGRRADPATAATTLSAVAAFRSIDAARLLVDMTAADRPGPVRAAAFASLIEMTGRDDLGSDPAAWREWLDRAAGLNEARWKDMLAEGIWRGAHRLAGERAGLVERMQDGYRRLYLTLPTNPGDERTKLTVQLLQSPLPELRGLAVEILNRELAAGNAVNSAVTDAAVALPPAPEPGLRAAAGRLLVQLGPADPGPLFARALDAESDPDVATSLLAGIARWPTSQAKEPVFRWLDRDPAPLRGAADAALAP